MPPQFQRQAEVDGISPVGIFKIGAFVILGIIILWSVLHSIHVVPVKGNEVVVMQDWKRGILPNVLGAGTQFINGWTTEYYVYNIGTQKTTFDEQNTNPGAEYGRIVIDCGENGGQKAYIAMSINYRLGWEAQNGSPIFSPEKIIKLHKDGVGKTYEDVIIKRTVIDVVNRIARPNQALEIYSGQGFVTFKEKVDEALKNHPVFKDRGIYVENTIIYKVYLDPQYEAEIAAKVLAVQQTLKLKEQTKAEEERAKMIFAQSQAKVEQVRQEAEGEKIKMVTAAEANKQQQILAAEAEKAKRVLEAEGNRDANLANASGVLALGKAEAEVAQLKTNSLYAGEGGARRAQIELAGVQADRLKNMLAGVQIVPEKTILSIGRSSGLTVNPDESVK
jgi:regulator of protease activity HflC (stomatin/prohibitin superfamily)